MVAAQKGCTFIGHKVLSFSNQIIQEDGVDTFYVKSLDNREFMSWLMDRFDLENMRLEIGKGK
jgi:hypothetical protein